MNVAESNRRGLDIVIKHFGNRRQLARALDVSDFTVAKWLERGCLSSRRVDELVDMTGIELKILRADLYDKREIKNY